MQLLLLLLIISRPSKILILVLEYDDAVVERLTSSLVLIHMKISITKVPTLSFMETGILYSDFAHRFK